MSYSSESVLSVTAQVSSTPDSDEHSLAFFFHNCITNDNKYYPCLANPDNNHLLTSIKAFSLSSISKDRRDLRLANSARLQYGKALRLTNAALGNPCRATKDETLLAILVLANYETLNGGADRTLDAWEQHIKGATSLLSLRGLDGVRQEAGRVLTLHVITSINAICLFKCLPTPAFVRTLYPKIFEYLYTPDSPAVQYQRVNLECADFRHAVTKHLITSPSEIIVRAAKLDMKLLAALANAPPDWEPEVILYSDTTRPDTDSGLPDFEMRYVNQATNYVWTSFRSSRILLHELVLGALSFTESIGGDVRAYQSARQHSSSVVQQCQKQILASMPQFTSQTSRDPWSQPSGPVRYHLPEVIHSSMPIMRALFHYGVLWPLFVAGICSSASPKIVDYVKDTFKYFGEELNIEQALVLRGML